MNLYIHFKTMLSLVFFFFFQRTLSEPSLLNKDTHIKRSIYPKFHTHLLTFGQLIVINNTYSNNQMEYKLNTEDAIAIYNSEFVKCRTSTEGGAVKVRISALTVEGSRFSHCSAPLAGAIYAVTSNSTQISKCCFHHCCSDGMYHTFFLLTATSNIYDTSMAKTVSNGIPYMSGFKNGSVQATFINSSQNHMNSIAALAYVNMGPTHPTFIYCAIHNTTSLSLLHYTKLTTTVDCQLVNSSIVSNIINFFPVSAFRLQDLR